MLDKVNTFFGKLKEMFSVKKRYVYNNDELRFDDDKLIRNIIIVSLSVVVCLSVVILYQHNLNKHHKDVAMKHYEKVVELQDSISEATYIKDEQLLFTEIGIVSSSRDCEPCTEENICKYIDYLHEMGVVWFPEIIKSNCQIESGFGKSDVAKKYNNLFGMDHPNVRKSLSTHKSGRFATFKNWKCSVLDRVLWDYSVFKNKIPTEKQYKEKINNQYNVEEQDYYKLLIDCSKTRNNKKKEIKNLSIQKKVVSLQYEK